MAKKKRKRMYQIALYVTPQLRIYLSRESIKRRRKLGPTVIEILREYFKIEEPVNEPTVAPQQQPLV